MFLILGSVAITTVVVALGLVRRLFTPDHRLLPLPRRPETTSRSVRRHRFRPAPS
jgi:putative ABC transport system permease protein